MGILGDRVIPEGARALPDIAAFPRLDERHHREHREQSREHGARRSALVQPPGQREEEPDVGKVGVPIGHDRLTDAEELEHQRDVDEEEREAEEHRAAAAEEEHDRREEHHERAERDVVLGIERRALPRGIGVDRGEPERKEELHHIHRGPVAREEDLLEKGPLLRRGHGACRALRRHGQDAHRRRHDQERDLLHPHARAPRPLPEPVDRQEREREDHRGGLGRDREKKKKPCQQEPRHPPGIEVSQIRQQAREVEQGIEHVLPLRDPGHGFHVHRVDPKEERRDRGGPEPPARELPDEEEHETGVQDVKEQVDPVVREGLGAREGVVHGQGRHRERVVVAAQRSEEPAQRRVRHDRVLRHVVIVVPVRELVVEAGHVDEVGDEEDRAQPERPGRAAAPPRGGGCFLLRSGHGDG